MGSRDLSARPIGSVHPSQRCYACGARNADMTMVLVKTTMAWAWLCTDAVACLRRRRNVGDQGKLFLRNPKASSERGSS